MPVEKDFCRISPFSNNLYSPVPDRCGGFKKYNKKSLIEGNRFYSEENTAKHWLRSKTGFRKIPGTLS
jgi:hypothetical protein